MKIKLLLGLALLVFSILIIGCGAPGTWGGAVSPFMSGGSTAGSGSTGSSTSTQTSGVTTLASNLTSPYDIVTDGTYVYWTENTGTPNGKVRKIKLDATQTSPTDVAVSLANPMGISLSGEYIYFTQHIGTTGKVSKVLKTATSGTVTDIATNLNYPAFCANFGGYCYFTESVVTTGTLKRVDEAGASSAVTLASTLNNPWALAVNENNGDVYFTEYVGSGSGKIRKYTASGGAVSSLYTSAYFPADIAINTGSSSVIVYWTEYESSVGKVAKITDGSSTATYITVTNSFGLLYLSGYLYFGENTNVGDVKKMSIDFTSSTTPTDLSTGQNYPFQFTGSGSTIVWTENNAGNGGTGLSIKKYTP